MSLQELRLFRDFFSFWFRLGDLLSGLRVIIMSLEVKGENGLQGDLNLIELDESVEVRKRSVNYKDRKEKQNVNLCIKYVCESV